jgi:hypothetical protein
VWARLKLVGEDEEKPFQLCCCRCGASCQLRNIAKWHSGHSQTACDKQLTRSATGGARTPGLASRDASASGAGMDNFAASKDQQEAFVDNLVKAMATGCIPFTFVENEYLRRDASSVGAKVPSRKEVAGTLLDRIFEETVLFSEDRVSSMDHPAGASDGWRKKFCEQGAGLMNFTVNGDGEALLFDVRNCSGTRQDAQGIALLLSEVGCEVMGGKEHAPIFAGWTLDNTRANRAAMSLLEVEHPSWVCVGCSAHGVHLAMKDFCKHSFSRGRTTVEWGVKWLADVNKDANTVANFLNDSSTAKALLRCYQKEVYGGYKQITVSVPTRFATNLFVMRSLQDSKAALFQAIGNLKWDSFGGKAAEVRDIMVSPLFWTLLAQAITFLAPFSDFIHQIEADRPSLARCYDGFDQLDRHVRACLQRRQEVDSMKEGCSSALRTWERRLDNTHGTSVVPLLSAAHTAAYLLDPLYAKVGGKDVLAPDVLGEREEAARDLIERIRGGAAKEEIVAFCGGWMEWHYGRACQGLCSDPTAGAGRWSRSRGQACTPSGRLGQPLEGIMEAVWEAHVSCPC